MMKTCIYVTVLVLLTGLLRLQAQSLKVGHARIDYLVSQTPAAKEANNQLTLQQTQVQNELKRLQKELRDKYALYQQQLATLSDVVRKDKEKEIQTLQQRIEEFAKTAEQSLQGKYKQLMSPIITKIQQAIDTVAKQNGYTYIINVSTENGINVLYAVEELDISSLVLKQMGITPTKPTSDLTKPAQSPAVKKP